MHGKTHNTASKAEYQVWLERKPREVISNPWRSNFEGRVQRMPRGSELNWSETEAAGTNPGVAIFKTTP